MVKCQKINFLQGVQDRDLNPRPLTQVTVMLLANEDLPAYLLLT
jgi:hypothetical protein